MGDVIGGFICKGDIRTRKHCDLEHEVRHLLRFILQMTMRTRSGEFEAMTLSIQASVYPRRAPRARAKSVTSAHVAYNILSPSAVATSDILLRSQSSGPEVVEAALSKADG